MKARVGSWIVGIALLGFGSQASAQIPVTDGLNFSQNILTQLNTLQVTLNQVDVTPDLKHAHAYVSILGKEGQAAAMAKLEENRVVLQTALAKSVTLKYTPHLIFHLDDSIERGARVFEILQQIETPERASE